MRKFVGYFLTAVYWFNCFLVGLVFGFGAQWLAGGPLYKIHKAVMGKLNLED